MTPGLRRLYSPRPVPVVVGAGGAPREVEGVAVEAVREEWLVEDRWWAPRPLRRRNAILALMARNVKYSGPPGPAPTSMQAPRLSVAVNSTGES